MSELKAFRIIQGDTGGYGAPSYKCDTDGNRIEEWSDACEVYDKSEADKVIAEKDAEIAELKEHNENYRFDNKNMLHKIMKQDAELRHSKYKRCLDKAEWCEERIARIERDYAFWQYGKDYAQNFYKKWRKRWLELADQFKPNSTSTKENNNG